MQQDYFLENVLRFVHMLRRVGLPVSSEQVLELTQAFGLIDIGSREQVFYTTRSLLISRYEHLALFETLFNRFWRSQPAATVKRGQPAPIAPRHDRRHHQPLLITYMARKAQASDPEIEVIDKSGTYSDIELLQRKDFSTMTDEELRNVKRLIQAMRWQVSLRQTRRLVSDDKGRHINMRRVLAASVRQGGIPLKLFWQAPKIKQRPLVLLADISGSMEKYSRLMLQFFYAIAQSLKSVECFAFGTRLTRITPALKLKNIDRALDEAAREVVDWSGGTRIGESLHAFNRTWSRRVLRRGAVVLIISDGWERGDVQMLKQEIRYLQLRCHRLIWLNPLLGKATYKPLVEGMQVALQYVDDFLPIHNLQSLNELAVHLQSLNERRVPKRTAHAIYSN